ncbi:MAG: DUF2283 domain-containing protein [Rubrobacteraceae bacterium]
MKATYFDDTDSMIVNMELADRKGSLRYIETNDPNTLIWVDEAGRVDSIEIMGGASAYDLMGMEPYRGDAKAEYEAAVRAARTKR